ncbi:MAG: PAS domain-containing protein [Myxococcales bacterium]|nr:PAS domain-containing protein [Myxococcales bacterium]MCA9568165.1 PAS domain-containing protein [Myxococcales bacterium]MCB9671820.1 PAS domain-containing protein [Alphaproteobacteria bacterium]
MLEPVDEMRSWLELGPLDSERLKELVPVVEPHVGPIIDRFYASILRHPGSNTVLTGPEQVERLKRTLRQWLREVFEGPHDLAYVERRRTIGRRHVQVGLPDRYMFLAMHQILHDLTVVVRAEMEAPERHLDSLCRVLMFDLALMTGTYVQQREVLQLDTLQALLVKHLRLSVFLVDNDGFVRAATDASLRMAGLTDPRGQSWRAVLPKGLLEAGHLEAEVHRARTRRRAINLPRVDVDDPDGTMRSYRVHLVPLDHTLASLLVQIEDLTDAVDLESRLRSSEALAQLGSLSAAVSHELRNPLAGISGALQVISRSMKDGDPHRNILQKVDAEVKRLNALVSDLLAFARPGTARLGNVDLRQLASETMELVATDHPAVAWELEGDGRATADPDLVRQILHNLLRNAVDAAGSEGRVRIEVDDGRLRVGDSGTGVPEAQRTRVFEPFVTTKTRGTGLGLAISRRNAEAMHGSLKLVEDSPLCGACFELAVPPGLT